MNHIDPEEVLLLAAHEGLLQDLELGLKLGASANLIDETGYSVLHLGVLSNHPAIVRRLVAAEAQLEVNDDDGLTPLQLGVNAKRYVSVQAIISLGANVNAAWPDSDRLLHKLAEDDKWSLIDEALRAGADVHAIGALGKTALQIAAEKGHERSVRTLLSSGAELADLKSVDLSHEVAKVVSAWRAGQLITDAG